MPAVPRCHASAPRPRRGALGLGLVLSTTACAGGIDDPDRFPPPVCPVRGFDAPRDLFVARCADAGCHGATTPAAGLDLVSPGVTSRLLDTPSTCGGAPLVDTSSPAASVLLDRVRAVPRCGGETMPLMGRPLDSIERGCLEAWVSTVAGGETP